MGLKIKQIKAAKYAAMDRRIVFWLRATQATRPAATRLSKRPRDSETSRDKRH